jgi:hypothetical protein
MSLTLLAVLFYRTIKIFWGLVWLFEAFMVTLISNLHDMPFRFFKDFPAIPALHTITHT